MPMDEITIKVWPEEDVLDLEAMLGGRRVGHAWCSLQDRRLRIGDIGVDDGLGHTECCPGDAVVPPGPSFRGKGIGNLILERLLTEAAALGVVEVWGVVVQDDLDRAPFLLRWYERHGFTISEPDEECRDLEATKKISKKMLATH